MVVIPDECSSFQNKFDGCAYANPVAPVLIPGFTPTSRRIRFGEIASRRRDCVHIVCVLVVCDRRGRLRLVCT